MRRGSSTRVRRTGLRPGTWLGLAALVASLSACAAQPSAAPPAASAQSTAAQVATAVPASPRPSPSAEGALAGPTAARPSPVAAASSVTALGTGASASGRPALKVAYVAPVAAMAPLWMAADSGAFQRRGVDVSMSYIAANASVAALLARGVDALEISGPAVLSANLHGAPLVFIGSGLNRAILSLIVAPSVHAAADLKGKPIASDRPGTPNDYAARAVLNLLGLKPTDVQLLPLGSAAAQFGALHSGQVAGAILGPPQSFQAEADGFHDLQDTFKVPYQNVGIVVQRDRIDQLMPALVPFLEAYRDGIAAYYSQPDLARKVLQKYTKESDPTILEKTYQFHITQAPFQRDLQPTRSGIQSMLTFLTPTVPQAAKATPAQFIDTRVLDRLPAQ